ncbi:hypothetical protein BpHYR1_013919 [Brachionus plicatilis]|uniref:Uncharacterized protein n=1 Tax=Brachionus plicatilis TaxID=10195 RepID=A0A3M7R487_BRAPC|nr:hypothetical protein BpHYR1_013919 [Brachionus plicatilis]
MYASRKLSVPLSKLEHVNLTPNPEDSVDGDGEDEELDEGDEREEEEMTKSLTKLDSSSSGRFLEGSPSDTGPVLTERSQAAPYSTWPWLCNVEKSYFAYFYYLMGRPRRLDLAKNLHSKLDNGQRGRVFLDSPNLIIFCQANKNNNNNQKKEEPKLDPSSTRFEVNRASETFNSLILFEATKILKLINFPNTAIVPTDLFSKIKINNFCSNEPLLLLKKNIAPVLMIEQV